MFQEGRGRVRGVRSGGVRGAELHRSVSHDLTMNPGQFYPCFVLIWTRSLFVQEIACAFGRDRPIFRFTDIFRDI